MFECRRARFGAFGSLRRTLRRVKRVEASKCVHAMTARGVEVEEYWRSLRCSTVLIGYDFGIDFVNATKLGQADDLSRLMLSHRAVDEEGVIVVVEGDVNSVLQDCIRKLLVGHENVRVYETRSAADRDCDICEKWKMAKGRS